MNPLLICSYKGRYLEVMLRWLLKRGVARKYRLLVWDNGGAADVCARYGIACSGVRDRATGQAINLGKAGGMRYLIDIAREKAPRAVCYVCADDDVVFDSSHLDALVEAALRPGLGMIGPRFHPFNTTMPEGSETVVLDPGGLRLRVYPPEERTVHNMGKVAGTLFAISLATVARLPWAPYLYPVPRAPQSSKPIVYWTEDATLDIALTRLGFVNGYLDVPGLTDVLHLPELNLDYLAWKVEARNGIGLSAENPF
jgi:hypothetical protein